MSDPRPAITFAAPNLLERLQASAGPYDEMPFGVVAMDRSGLVVGYNEAESALSGLDPARVLGRNFFEEVGPCTNNFLVAQRFADSETLDETIDYVFTFRMAPTPVRLRMLAESGSDRQFLVVERR